MGINLVTIIGIILAALIAHRLDTLNKSGVIGAIVVGLAVFFGTGFQGLVLLGFFFMTSSFWTKWKGEEKRSFRQRVEKGSTGRDFAQVLANGALPGLSSLLYAYTDSRLFLLAFTVSLAAANGDTWASEIGVLSKKKPVLLFSMKRAEPGTSGAVSFLGTMAGLAGSFAISFPAFLFWQPVIRWEDFFFLTLFGFFGMWIDTLFGLTVQERFRCNRCGKMTESKSHCGEKTGRVKGIPGITNDVVNLVSVLAVVFLLSIFYHFFG